MHPFRRRSAQWPDHPRPRLANQLNRLAESVPSGYLARGRDWDAELAAIDGRIEADLSKLPALLRSVPLAVWGAALLDPETNFPQSHRFLPVMPENSVQDRWTGGHGPWLLLRSADFLRQVLA